MSLPAAAHIVHASAFKVNSRVIAVEIPTHEQGVSRFLVTSNDGFGVEVEGFMGTVNTTVLENGTLASERAFGGEAQLPGAAQSCAQSPSNQSNPVYKAVQKTELSEGHIVDRAVVFEFRYDAGAKPSFEFVPGKENAGTPKACEA